MTRHQLRFVAIVTVFCLVSGLMANNTPKKFPFNMTQKLYSERFFGDGLSIAASENNIQMLQDLLDDFGGVFYHSAISNAALEAGNFEFWKMFVLGSCRTNILSFYSHHIFYFEFFMQPFHDLFYICIPDDIRLKAMEVLCKQYLPALPDEEDLDDESDFASLPRHRKYTIWSIPNFRTFPDDIPSRYKVIQLCIQRGDDRILRYVLEEVKAHTRLSHLQYIAMRFRPDLYDLVFQHLRPDIDRDQIPISCRYRDPQNDADFVIQFSNRYRPADQLIPKLLKFLEFHPQFKNKISAAKNFFEKMLADDDRDTTYPWLIYSFYDDDSFEDAIGHCQEALKHFEQQHDIDAVLNLCSPPWKYRIYHDPKEADEKLIEDKYPSDLNIAKECYRFCHDCAGEYYGYHDSDCSSSDSGSELEYSSNDPDDSDNSYHEDDASSSNGDDLLEADLNGNLCSSDGDGVFKIANIGLD